MRFYSFMDPGHMGVATFWGALEIVVVPLVPFHNKQVPSKNKLMANCQQCPKRPLQLIPFEGSRGNCSPHTRAEQ